MVGEMPLDVRERRGDGRIAHGHAGQELAVLLAPTAHSAQEWGTR
jgi:hypothetical protein